MQWLKIQLVYWPTLLWNVLLGRWLKIRTWWSEIDERIVVGAQPFKSDVQPLYDLGVRAVVNTCQEYRGPLAEYQRLGIEQFYMPTVDFTHPELADIQRAAQFIDAHVDKGERVYIHCKAGRARSATVALCWLCQRDGISPEQAQQLLLKKRPHTNPRVKDRPVVRQFMESLAAQSNDLESGDADSSDRESASSSPGPG